MPRSPKRFLRKTIETFVIIGVIITFIAPIAVFWTSWNHNRRYLESTANEIAEILAEDARYPLLVASRKDAQKLLSNAVKMPDVVRIVLLEQDGSVLASAESPRLINSKRVYPVIREIQAEERQASSGLEDLRVVLKSLGAIHLELSLDRGYAVSIGTAQQVAIFLIILSVILGLAVIRLSAQILRPLSALARFVANTENVSRSMAPPKQSSPWEVHSIYSAVSNMQERVYESQRRLRMHAESLEQKVKVRTADLEKARDEAERANQAKTLFLANVSHELRTPLQAIVAFAKMSVDSARESGLDRLQSILSASTHLMDLIEQLLVLSRAEAGHEIKLSYDEVNITDLVRETATTLRATLSERNTLVVEHPAEDIVAYSDRTRIRQLIVNLVRNADKYTDGGRIVLTVGLADSGTACISVWDEGIGIDPRDIDRIFAPFYQAHERIASTVPSGIGLGLWLSRQIADALGGSLEVSSTPGNGSVFTFRIPIEILSIPPKTLGEEDIGRDADSFYAVIGGIRVLLADDEELVRLPLAAILRQKGAIVDEVSDGREALESIEHCATPYDALILDHRMPYMHGIEILERLRTVKRDPIPVIVFTADDNSALFHRVEGLNGKLLVKPVLPETLMESLQSLLASFRRPHREPTS